MEIRRRTWNATIRLAFVASLVAVFVTVLAAQLSSVPDEVVVLPIIVVAFVASWVQTSRVRSEVLAAHAPIVQRSHVRPLAAPAIGHSALTTH